MTLAIQIFIVVLVALAAFRIIKEAISFLYMFAIPLLILGGIAFYLHINGEPLLTEESDMIYAESIEPAKDQSGCDGCSDTMRDVKVFHPTSSGRKSK